jgi:GNAT superfamily N-acetyltransferase
MDTYSGSLTPIMTSPDNPFHIRRARPDEADMLTDVSRRSKAYWGYSSEFMVAVMPILIVPAERIAQHPAYVAEDAQGIAGFYELIATEDPRTGWLESLFVEPRAIGQGCGKYLWQHALSIAREKGYTRIELESDPNAENFYRKMGAYVIGANQSTVTPGRKLPVMRCDL